MKSVTRTIAQNLSGIGLWRERQMDDERDRNQEVDAGIRGLEYLGERARRSRGDRAER